MNSDDPADLLAAVRDVRDRVVADGERVCGRWNAGIDRESFRASAANMAHFLAYRRIDLRPLQAALAPWGLASLDHLESRVVPTLESIIANLGAIVGADAERPTRRAIEDGAEALGRHTDEVFGPPPDGRATRIMVTLAAADAKNPDRVRGLFDAGMNVARINCGRDGPATWTATSRLIGCMIGRSPRWLLLR